MKVIPERQQLLKTIFLTVGIIVGALISTYVALEWPVVFWSLLSTTLVLLAAVEYRKKQILKDLMQKILTALNKNAGVLALIALIAVISLGLLEWKTSNNEKRITEIACKSTDVR